MGKKVLLISSDNTGHGHKSITESLCEKIKMDHDAEIHVIDGFSLGGPLLSILENFTDPSQEKQKMYGKWYIIFPPIILRLINSFIEILIRNRFFTIIR